MESSNNLEEPRNRNDKELKLNFDENQQTGSHQPPNVNSAIYASVDETDNKEAASSSKKKTFLIMSFSMQFCNFLFVHTQDV